MDSYEEKMRYVRGEEEIISDEELKENSPIYILEEDIPLVESLKVDQEKEEECRSRISEMEASIKAIEEEAGSKKTDIDSINNGEALNEVMIKLGEYKEINDNYLSKKEELESLYRELNELTSEKNDNLDLIRAKVDQATREYNEKVKEHVEAVNEYLASSDMNLYERAQALVNELNRYIKYNSMDELLALGSKEEKEAVKNDNTSLDLGANVKVETEEEKQPEEPVQNVDFIAQRNENEVGGPTMADSTLNEVRVDEIEGGKQMVEDIPVGRVLDKEDQIVLADMPKLDSLGTIPTEIEPSANIDLAQDPTKDPIPNYIPTENTSVGPTPIADEPEKEETKKKGFGTVLINGIGKIADSTKKGLKDIYKVFLAPPRKIDMSDSNKAMALRPINDKKPGGFPEL